MINIADNFNLAGSTKPLDSRDEFATLAAMKACTVCNELHICYNKETQKQYQYSSSNTNDTTTGKWREYIPGGGGGGTGTITGATVGGAQVPEVGGILQFQAYPTVPIKSIQVDGAQNPLNPDINGKVTIPAQPNVPITGINDANGNALTPVGGIVTLPQAAATPTADTMTYNDSTTYSNGSIGKALHDTIVALGYEYSTSSTIATNPSHNMYYDLTGSAISTLDVSGISPTNDKEIIILFLTSSGGCSITLAETPTPQRIIGSTALAKGQVYIMSILRGIVCLVEAPAFVAPVAVLSSESE